MRLVVDTNTVLSGLLWPGGAPGRLIDLGEAGRVELLSSPALLAELRDVLGRSKFTQQIDRRGISVADLFDGYAALVRLVKPLVTPRVIARDPDDDHVIACAVASRADLIVSGDLDLLDLGNHQGIRILKAADAVVDIAQRLSD